MNDRERLRQEILNNSGFSKIGIADFAILNEDKDILESWISSGMHGDMHYMERSLETRHDIRNVFSETQSVIITLTSYSKVEKHYPAIAAYAHSFKDYHKTIKDKLHLLLQRLQSIDSTVTGRAVVDSAPLFERSWAVRAGLGWIGRNSMLINPHLGSYTLIGILLINKKVANCDNIMVNDGCAEDCSLCKSVCPNQAINNNRTIDARRCISYITNECKSPPTHTYGHISGCDCCIEVCPHNSQIAVVNPAIKADWMNMTEAEFATQFQDSSLSRVGLNRIKSILSLGERE